MRLITVFIKTWRELSRDWLMLSLTVVFAPFFVWAYWLWTSGGSTSYTILVLNQDRGVQLDSGQKLVAGEELIQAIQATQYADGKPLLKVRTVDNLFAVEPILRDRGAVAFLHIPEGFSNSMASLQEGDRSESSQITFGGDLTNPYYIIGATIAITAVDAYVQETTGQDAIIQYIEEPIGASAARTEFEIYVPGILVFSVMMMIFLAAMSVTREVETGTLQRMQITRATSFDLLGGITLALVLVGVICVVLTFATALALGFRSQGPVWVAILVGAVTSLSIIGMGLIVACFSRTVSQAFVIANFPLGLFMFFTGSIFPIPKVTLFTISSHEIGLYDLLPPTHAVVALNKVLTLGAGLDEVTYELAALLILSVAYFAIGVWLFQRRQMQ